MPQVSLPLRDLGGEKLSIGFYQAEGNEMQIARAIDAVQNARHRVRVMGEQGYAQTQVSQRQRDLDWIRAKARSSPVVLV